MNPPSPPDGPAARPWLLTLGDPVGIGPEIAVKALAGEARPDTLIVGCPEVVRRAAGLLDPPPPVAVVTLPEDVVQVPPGAVGVLQAKGLPAGLAALPWGRIDARAGQAAALCIEQAVEWVRAGRGQGVVTAPVHKEALSAAGVPYPGHTEMLQALSRAPGGPLPPVRMMLANDQLRVVLVTIHMALRDAVEAIDADRVLETVLITHRALQAFGIERPRIAVAGLNPHAGEGGLFGREEIEHIAPAVARARAGGIDARGPFAPDTVFMRARDAAGHPGEFDVVVAMTHDHGLIPVKYLGVEEGVNVTLGLPFVRTSPDHGTAFDIAGQGRADAASLQAARRMARRLSRTPAGVPGGGGAVSGSSAGRCD